MKYVYRSIIVTSIVIWSVFCLLYLNLTFVDRALGRYNQFDISLSDGSNNKENTKLANSLYEDYQKSEDFIAYEYYTGSENQSVKTIVTTDKSELPKRIVNNGNITIKDFETLKEIKGSTLTVYTTKKKNSFDAKYSIEKKKNTLNNVFINGYYDQPIGLILIIGLTIIMTLVTLLYQESKKYTLNALMLDGNTDRYIYRQIFLKNHISIGIVSVIVIFIVMTLFKLFYIELLFYSVFIYLIAIIISVLSLKYIYCNYKLKSSNLKMINYLFQVIHLMTIILLVLFIGEVAGLYTHIQPNKDYEQIMNKMDGYETFVQSGVGSDTLVYEVKAPIYTDYYNFLNENYDTILSQYVDLSDDVNNTDDNQIIVVNQSYFNNFNVYDTSGRKLKPSDFDSEYMYVLSSTGLEINTDTYFYQGNPELKTIDLAPDQDIWYIDGSMSLYGAHALSAGNLLVIPDYISDTFKANYVVDNWINVIMSSSTLLVKNASNDELNVQYLKEHDLDQTFRKWSNVTDNYNKLMYGIYAKMRLYLKLIIITVILVVFLSLVDVYMYLKLNQRKIALQMLDGNGSLYVLRNYGMISFLKILVVTYVAFKVLHYKLFAVVISVSSLLVILIIIFIVAFSFISRNQIKFIKEER